MLSCLFVKAQPAFQYYTILQHAESSFVNGNLNEAILLYDSALEHFNYPFYNHIKQAAILSHYAGNDIYTEKFLTECIKAGMNKAELEWFVARSSGKPFINRLLTNYKIIRKEYASNIDTVAMINYLELDAIDVDVNGISYTKDDHSKEMKMKQDSLYIQLIERYIELIAKYGFPTEKRVGLDRIIHNENDNPFQSTWENTFAFEISYNKDLLIDTNNVKFWTNENFGTSKREGSRPGNYFLFHFGIRLLPYNNDSLMRILTKGMLELKVNPRVLMHHLELDVWFKSKEKLDDYFDCGCSYWSKAFVSEAHSVTKMQLLSEKTRDNINACRRKYFMRSIEMEEKIFNQLFYLEYRKAPKMYNKKTVNRISFTFNAFI